MHTALRSRERVDFINNDGVHSLQNSRRLAGEHEVEALRRGDKNVRRLTRLPVAFRLRGIAGAHRHRNIRHVQPHALCHTGNSGEWRA